MSFRGGGRPLDRHEEAISAPRQGLNVSRRTSVITQCGSNSRNARAQSLLDVHERVLTP